jgi:hypothetical protein
LPFIVVATSVILLLVIGGLFATRRNKLTGWITWPTKSSRKGQGKKPCPFLTHKSLLSGSTITYRKKAYRLAQ